MICSPKMSSVLAACAVAAALAACDAPEGRLTGNALAQGAAATAPFPMRTCVNLGNALDAPGAEGDWGYTIRMRDLDAIAAAGFEGIRLPVRWDTHAQDRPPYTIDAARMQRVAEVVDAALARGLKVQLDVHHFDPLNEAPLAYAPKLFALWRQISERFAGYPPGLIFEVLNEPHGDHWTQEALFQLHAGALREIRRQHPERLVVLGGLNWQSVEGFEGWIAPADRHIAVSIHSYYPYEFTYQNAFWLGENAPTWSRRWGSASDRRALQEEAARAAAVGRRLGLAVQVGEFGVGVDAPQDQRVAWLTTMRQALEAEGLAWCVWDWAYAFRVYETETEAFQPGMREALGL